MSLYQKYRPRDFDSLFWQEFVKVSLRNALLQDKLVWAYLFYWSRWTGKTTVARILAKAVNCTALTTEGNPCLECTNCKAFENEELIDIIEIDAASNTWVDNIRELIDRAQFQPNFGKFKIYIIDEVHMLSKWAFNALLKTLEEPPKHVKFILATTEIHKIPETIISRTQRYDFKKIWEWDIIERLRFIAHSELINAEEDALKLIARLSKWWLRDAISFFEQYSIGGILKLEYLKENLQLVWDEFIEEFLNNIITKNLVEVMKNLDFLREKWIDVKIFLEEFWFYIHNKIITSIDSPDFNDLMTIYDNVIDIYGKLKTVPNTFMLLEFSLLKYIKDYSKSSVPEIKEVIQKQQAPVIEKKVLTKKEEKISPKIEKEKTEEIKEITIEESLTKNEKVPQKEFEIWVLLDSIKKDSWKWFILMSLKSCNISLEDSQLKIIASNEFNYKKINTPEIVSYIWEKIEKIFWINAEIIIRLDKNNSIVDDALSVF